MDRINAEIVEAKHDLPDRLLLMSLLHGLLALQFSNLERHDKNSPRPATQIATQA